MRKIFIDCGAHDGCSIESFVKKYNDYNEYEIYSFECDSKRFEKLLEKGKMLNLSNFIPSKKAIWISEGLKQFDGWQFVNTNNVDDGSGVETINLSQFILDNFSKNDFIILKLDIEGAEYEVINKMYKEGSLNFISKIYGELHGPKKGYTVEQNEKILKQIWDCNLQLINWDALGGSNKEIEIVPFDTPNSYMTSSSPRVGHAYKEIMKKITFCIPSKSNLRYLKTCIPSIRKNAYRDDHEIIVFVDQDEDGTVKWLDEVKNKYNIQYYVNPKLGEELFGIGMAYDFCVAKSNTDIFMIFHADMMLGKHADLKAYNHLKEKTVVCSTRVEPPLHPNNGEKIIEDFGMWPEEFKEKEFDLFVEANLSTTKTTEGIFAPWMMYKKEFTKILGGHDPKMHSCREDSDIFNRMLLAEFNFIQPWNSLVYHLTGRGAGSFGGDEKRHEQWKKDMNKSTLEFIRKWGTGVKHTKLMKPIVVPVYKKSVIIKNSNPQIEQMLEPWFNNGDGIIVEVDGATFTNEDYIYIQQLNEILAKSVFLEEDFGDKFEVGNLQLTVNNIETIEKDLIKWKNTIIKQN